jgi:hypothetical protein
MREPELVRRSQRCAGGDRGLASGLKQGAATRLVGLPDAGRVCGERWHATGASPHSGRPQPSNRDQIELAGARECKIMTRSRRGASGDPSRAQELRKLCAIDRDACMNPGSELLGAGCSSGPDVICASSPNQVSGLLWPCPPQVLKKLVSASCAIFSGSSISRGISSGYAARR